MTDKDWVNFLEQKVRDVTLDIEREQAGNDASIVLYGLRQKRSAYQECLQQAQKGVW